METTTTSPDDAMLTRVLTQAQNIFDLEHPHLLAQEQERQWNQKINSIIKEAQSSRQAPHPDADDLNGLKCSSHPQSIPPKRRRLVGPTHFKPISAANAGTG